MFDFGPLPDNPKVPRGSYRVFGTSKALGGGVVAVRLEPLKWIEHPGEYMMVGLEATTDRERSELSGTITNDSCGEVVLKRVE